MVKLSESALKRLIKGGETTTVELKLASPRPVEMAERLCGMANAQGGVVVVGVEDSERKIVGVPDDRIAMTIDTILRAAEERGQERGAALHVTVIGSWLSGGALLYCADALKTKAPQAASILT